jgi:hypothetical protein
MSGMLKAQSNNQMQTYCWGDKKDCLVSRLPPEAKNYLDKVLKDNNVDTLKWYRIKSDEAYFTYTTGSFLSANSYKVYNWVNCGGTQPFNQGIERLKNKSLSLKKILIFYSVSQDNQCQNMVIYIF